MLEVEIIQNISLAAVEVVEVTNVLAVAELLVEELLAAEVAAPVVVVVHL